MNGMNGVQRSCDRPTGGEASVIVLTKHRVVLPEWRAVKRLYLRSLDPEKRS